MSMINFFILAGGSGTRLWPLSRKNFPKQFIKFLFPGSSKKESFFQKTLKRCQKFKNARIFILTNEKYKFYILDQIRECLGNNFKFFELILEPEAKNTAPAIALGIKYAEEKGISLNDIFCVLPSDHFISPEEKFVEYLEKGVELASKGYIVTFGVKPTKPETGYGYIKAGRPIENGFGFEVEKFTEKPDFKKALEYLSSGKYFWNAGIFIFKGEVIKKEIKEHSPEIAKIFDLSYKEAIKTFSQVSEISIDYAVMEKTKRACVVPLEITWSDVGSWDSLEKLFEKDKNGNVFIGNIIAIDAENNFVFGNKRLLALLGVEGLIVIETEDSLFITKKGTSQKVREVVKELLEKNRLEALEHPTVFRPWGFYTLFEKGQGYKIKKIVVNPGEKLSLQMHRYRSEHWVVVKGIAKVRIGEKEFFVKENESIFVPKNTLHRLENPGNIPLEIIEVQVGEYVEEDDIIRFEDIYERV